MSAGLFPTPVQSSAVGLAPPSEPLPAAQTVSFPQTNKAEEAALATKLRAQTAACRVRHEKLGVRKSLTKEQMRQIAENFHAESKTLTAAKRLLDTKDPAYRAVQVVKSRAGHYWKSMTTPYPEPGIRLIRKSSIDAFNAKMVEFKAELRAAAVKLQEKYSELRERAQVELGSLFNPADYPTRIDDEFDLDWDYPSIDPPAYLKELNPKLYEEECDRIRGRFEEAVRLTEQAMAAQLHELISHLAERLKGDMDGKPKTFRDSAVTKLNEFFGQFKDLDIGSGGELQHLVDQAKHAMQGVAPDELRANGDLRSKVVDKLAEIQGVMDGMMISRPKRAIDLEGT